MYWHDNYPKGYSTVIIYDRRVIKIGSSCGTVDRVVTYDWHQRTWIGIQSSETFMFCSFLCRKDKNEEKWTENCHFTIMCWKIMLQIWNVILTATNMLSRWWSSNSSQLDENQFSLNSDPLIKHFSFRTGFQATFSRLLKV